VSSVPDSHISNIQIHHNGEILEFVQHFDLEEWSHLMVVHWVGSCDNENDNLTVHKYNNYQYP